MVRPLTKRTRKGEPYARPPEVEATIKVALREDRTTLDRRLKVTDGESACGPAVDPGRLPRFE